MVSIRSIDYDDASALRHAQGLLQQSKGRPEQRRKAGEQVYEQDNDQTQRQCE